MVDDNPFEKKYGAALDAQSASTSSAAPSPQGGSTSNPFEDKYGKLLDAQKPTAEQQAQATKDQAYESKIAQATPAMKKFAEDQGVMGALSLGKQQLGETLGVNAVARGLAAGLGAGGQGSLSERYQNLKAQDEALRRETEKQHPIATGVGEFAGYSTLPAGRIAGPVESVLSKYVPEAVAGVAGVGAEAGAFGGASAAAEQAYGTKSERDKPSILGATAEGTLLGAGLGTAGKAIGYGIEKIPQKYKDIITSFGNQDETIFNKMSDAYKRAEAAGETTMSHNDFIKAIQNGEQPTLASLSGGKIWNSFLEDTFKNHPEAAEKFVSRISDKIQKQQEDYSDFLQRMAGTSHLNADTLREQARATAETKNDDAYLRLWQNGNGAGTWSSLWNKFLDNPDFVQIIKDTNNTLAQVKPGFKNPFELKGDQSLGNFKIDSDILNKLAAKGIVDVSDVAGMDKNRLVKLLFEKPTIQEGTPSGAAYRQNLDATRLAQRQADVVLNTVKKNPIKMTLTDPQAVDMRYLDILQRKLGEQADRYFGPTTSNQEFGHALNDIRNKITGDLKDPKSKVYNQDFHDAHEAYKDFRGANNSFDYGLQIFSTDPKRKGEMINAVQKMAPDEREHFVRGVLSKFNSDLENSRNISKTITRFDSDLEKPHIRDVLKQAMGPNQFDNFTRYTKTLSLLNKTNDLATKYMGKPEPSLWTPLNVVLFAIDNWKALPKIMTDIGYRYLDSRYAEKLAEKLASPDINEFMKAYNSIKNNKNALRVFKDGLDKFANSASAMQGGVRQFHDGGYVEPHKGGGGEIARAIPVIKQLTQPIVPKTHYNHGGIVVQSHTK